MLKALVPLIVGIVAAGRCSLPVWGVAAALVVSVAAAVWWWRRDAADLFLAVAMFLAGWCAAEIRPAPVLPEGERVMELAVDEILARRDGVTQAEGRVVACAAEDGAGVAARGLTVRISAPEALRLREGERVEALCRVRPFGDGGYGLYMWRRGVAGGVWLDTARVVRRGQMAVGWPRRLRHGAVERISRLGLAPETEAVVRAMAVGDRSGLTPGMRSLHARAGTSHLLAVSGLHVGFVFVLVNLLLWWVPALRYGYVWRCLLTIGAIWVYAAVAGFSPSVVRAATMFSVFQTAMAATVRFDSLNSLSLAACLMLIFDARTLYDAGFRLSFLSVAAIIEWGGPLYRRVARREPPLIFRIPRTPREHVLYYLGEAGRRLLRWLWGALSMGAAASVATAPLVSYLFGTVSLWGVVAGPVAVLLGGVTVASALVWVVLPLPLLQPVASWVVRTAAGALERLVAACAGSGTMVAEHNADGVWVAAMYAAMALFTVWLWSRGKPRAARAGRGMRIRRSLGERLRAVPELLFRGRSRRG